MATSKIRRLPITTVFVLLACGPTSSGGSDGTDDTTTSTTSSETQTVTSLTTVGSSEESSTGAPPAECGNGTVEEGELCDDGNDVEEDECDSNCVPACGPLWMVPVADAGEVVNPTYIDVDGSDSALVAGGLLARDAALLWQRNFSIDGRPGPSSTLDLGLGPMAGSAAAVLDQDGNWLAVVQADPMADYELGKYDGTDGSLLWSYPIVDPYEEDFGLAVAADNHVILAATVRLDDMDTDVWVAKLDTTDASEIWSTTHTGPTDGGFSIDRGGPATVDNDGNVLVLGTLRENFETFHVTLIKFPADGGAALWDEVPSPDPGGLWSQEPLLIDVDPAGGVVVSINEFGPSPGSFHGIVARYEDDQQTWLLDGFDLDREDVGEAHMTARFGFDQDGNTWVAGDYRIDPAPADYLFGMWVTRLDAGGTPTCQYRHLQDGVDQVAGAIDTFSDGTAAIVTLHQGAIAGGAAGFIGRFRP